MTDILFKLPEIYSNAKQLCERISKQEMQCEYEITETTGVTENCLVFGNNLNYMKYLIDRGMSGKINMIYSDPPFFSKSDYSINVKAGSGKRKMVIARNPAFSDKWKNGMEEYLTEITAALMLMHELLDERGSIFVHLDWHSTHYIKVIMDAVFGEKNFINEIIWNYKSGGVSKKYFARKHDTILFYSKSRDYFFEPQQEKSYNRGLKPYRFKGVKEYKDTVGWYTLVNMKDVWQIDMVGRTSSERTGYATQKPEALIKRILTSVTKEGDLCADFYCGSGTLGAVCHKMGRRYILCDSGVPAVTAAHKRLLELKSAHAFMSETPALSDNFCADISIDRIEGLYDSVTAAITGISYRDLELPGIALENSDLMETLIDNHYDQLIEYWCVDCDYDGKVFRPDIYRFSSAGMIDVAVEIPVSMVKNLTIRVVDKFGNVFQKSGIRV